MIESAFKAKNYLYLTGCRQKEDIISKSLGLEKIKSKSDFENSEWVVYRLKSLYNYFDLKANLNNNGGKVALTKSFCTILHKTFPALESIVIHFNFLFEPVPSPDSVFMLINLWTTSLTTIVIEMQIPESQIPKLFKNLSLVPQLQHLHLALNFNRSKTFTPTKIDITQLQPTLCRLKRFSADLVFDFVELVLALKPICTHLNLARTAVTLHDINLCISKTHPRLVFANLTHIDVKLKEADAFEKICMNIPSLQVFKANFPRFEGVIKL